MGATFVTVVVEQYFFSRKSGRGSLFFVFFHSSSAIATFSSLKKQHCFSPNCYHSGLLSDTKLYFCQPFRYIREHVVQS